MLQYNTLQARCHQGTVLYQVDGDVEAHSNAPCSDAGGGGEVGAQGHMLCDMTKHSNTTLPDVAWLMEAIDVCWRSLPSHGNMH